MPWTSSKEGTLPSLKNKSQEAREIFARVANAALAKGQSEEESIYAGLAAVSAQERKRLRDIKKDQIGSTSKTNQNALPAHLAAVLGVCTQEVQKAAVEPLNEPQRYPIKQAFLGKNALVSDPNRSLTSASWDNFGRLILQFDDGKQIITDRIPVEERIEQSIGVSVNPVFDYLRFNTEANVDQLLPGWLSWNSFEDCLNIQHSDGSTLQVGLENYIEVINNTGSTLANGAVVKFSGVALNEIPECSALTASPDFAPLLLIGVLTNELVNGQRGRATVLGKVRQLNTTGSTVGETWLQGDLLWAHPTIAGAFTRVKPSAPNPAISVAAVLKVDSTQGVILVRPTIFPRLYYAKYRSLVSQLPALANTPYSVIFGTTDIQSGIEILNSRQIKVQQSGLYSFDFRLQLTSSNSSQKNVYVWARKNGTDVPDSCTKVTLVGNGVSTVASWNYVYSMAQGDYFELMFAADDVAISIDAPAPTAFCPATPSAEIKVTQIDL